MALSFVAGIGNVTSLELIERFGTASHALHALFPRDTAARALADADRALARASARALTLTTPFDAHYPEPLRHLTDPPVVLWSSGDWTTLRAPVVAIVGTRRATTYGKRMTRELAGALARAGACIVSGMAIGIDAAAHAAALEVGGRTAAVLGTGADVAYPAAHVALRRSIAERGLILSEIQPGARAGAGSFPRRNRIIAGLASLTIVVEAPIQSGALITANDALDLGRDIAAVPGPIDAPQSAGSNRLLHDGAHVIASVADALFLVGLEPPRRIDPQLLDDAERRIWTALDGKPLSIDELCAQTKLPVAQCMTTVTALELRGIIECALTGVIHRR